jgi:hypothetical protein
MKGLLPLRKLSREAFLDRWIVIKPELGLGYSTNSLVVTMYLLPRFVSRIAANSV